MAESHRQPPLSYEASATETRPEVSSSLPSEVVTCLKNSRFLHLATCDGLTPHVSLMSYTYLPASPYHSHPIIIMTTNSSSRKTLNLQSNPRVSLLVHDWVSHRPPTASIDPSGEASSPPAANRSSLASLLMSLNTSALSSISTTITGTATFCDVGSEEERWCKERHLENNTFSEEGTDSVVRFGTTQGGSAQASVDDDARVVVVKVTEGRIADHKGCVRDWKLVQPDTDQSSRS
ncbi:hypothetical protein KEM56_001187 [Ascosphaera pollenicola]|nr:hypothetical protein KEM56_001187 [Ascosphaera pollenicola]